MRRSLEQDKSARISSPAVLGAVFKRAVLGAAFVTSTACASAPYRLEAFNDNDPRCQTALAPIFNASGSLSLLNEQLRPLNGQDKYRALEKWAEVMLREQEQMADPVNIRLFDQWMSQFDDVRGKSDDEKMKAVKIAVEKYILYETDDATYGKSEYWATAYETLKRGQGDCEDLARLGYMTMRAMHVPVQKSYMGIVDGNDGAPGRHAVLIFDGKVEEFYTRRKTPVGPETPPGAPRTSYTLYYAMNEEGMWYAPQKTEERFGKPKITAAYCVPHREKTEMTALARR